MGLGEEGRGSGEEGSVFFWGALGEEEGWGNEDLFSVVGWRVWTELWVGSKGVEKSNR